MELLIKASMIIAAALIGGVLTHLFSGRDSRPPLSCPTAILERVHMTGELTTAVGCVQAIVRSEEVRELLKLRLGSVEALYVAVGEVRAGIDMTEINEENLRVEGTKITVTIPPCQIIDAKLDVMKSYVFDVKRSMAFAPDGIHLQTKAERQALQEIQEMAKKAGLLDQARKQAKMLLRYWFESSGFKTVEFHEMPHAENTSDSV